jgi:hypothetical protein
VKPSPGGSTRAGLRLLGSCPFNRFDCIGEAGDPVRQKNREAIRGNGDDSDVNPARRQVFPQMGDIDDQKIAPSGNLNLHAKADSSPVDCQALGPVHSSGTHVRPPAGLAKSSIEDRPDLASTIGMPTLLKTEIETGEDVEELFPEGFGAQAFRSAPSPRRRRIVALS